MNSLLLWVAKLAFGKKLLSLVDAGNNALTGYRTQIIAVLAVIVAALEHLNVIPVKVGDPIVAALIGALPLTLAEKVGNVLDEANKILPPPTTPPIP